MTEAAFDDKTNEVKSYLEAVEKCRKATQQVTKAVEHAVALLTGAAGTYYGLVHYPGAPQEMMNYYLDSSRRLNTFMLEEMEGFGVVWRNNVVYQLDNLAYNAQCAITAAKRRREARERYLKCSQKSPNPFAATVSPDKTKQRKEEYVLCSEQFDETYKAFNGLRTQTVGMLQAHYFHDHSVMLRKLSETLKLRSSPPPPPPPLHSRDGFNEMGLRSPSASHDDSVDRNCESSPTTGATPSSEASNTADNRAQDALEEGNQEAAGRGDGSAGGGSRRQTTVRSSHTSDEAAFREVGEDGAGVGRSSNTSSTNNGGSGGATVPRTNPDTERPPAQVQSPTKPHDRNQQRRVSQTASASFGAGSHESFPEAEAATASGRANAEVPPVNGIPVLAEPSPYKQYEYQSRPPNTTAAERREERQNPCGRALPRDGTCGSIGEDDAALRSCEGTISPPDVSSTKQRRRQTPQSLLLEQPQQPLLQRQSEQQEDSPYPMLSSSNSPHRLTHATTQLVTPASGNDANNNNNNNNNGSGGGGGGGGKNTPYNNSGNTKVDRSGGGVPRNALSGGFGSVREQRHRAVNGNSNSDEAPLPSAYPSTISSTAERGRQPSANSLPANRQDQLAAARLNGSSNKVSRPAGRPTRLGSRASPTSDDLLSIYSHYDIYEGNTGRVPVESSSNLYISFYDSPTGSQRRHPQRDTGRSADLNDSVSSRFFDDYGLDY